MEIDTPIGKLGIKINNGKLTDIEWVQDFGVQDFEPLQENCALQNNVSKQLQQYFINPRHKFNLPLDPEGTKFQKRVWQALCDIPPGATKTYGKLAKQLNTSPRAIGNACRKNPIPIVIPCHRVVAKNSLGGFGGERQGKLIAIKGWLLNHEA